MARLSVTGLSPLLTVSSAKNNRNMCALKKACDACFLLVCTSISFHKKLASLLATNFIEDLTQNIKHFIYDLDRHVYEHLDMTPLINRKDWSPNRIKLCLEIFHAL